MRILVVQNYADANLGQIASVLDESAMQVDLRQAYAGAPLPRNDADYHGLIVLGGEQNALADEQYPYFPPLLELIRAFGDADKSVLGICLGSQLVARAYGGENVLNRPIEFGWKEVRLTDAGQKDPVLSAAPSAFQTFHWHRDSFSLPEGAVHLAQSAMTPNQAFRLGRAVYATQFHFEADARLVSCWAGKYADFIESVEPGWTGRFTDMLRHEGAKADEVGRALAHAWVATVGGG
ncbi:type 1 glutamine amidotransferase [Daeguia caeni]|uniref:Type 1 glutamine amidotransferase n=1 Tax=Daeguia caeni TaxID=439612 RepID=A0ABV9H9L2_9HYPH